MANDEDDDEARLNPDSPAARLVEALTFAHGAGAKTVMVDVADLDAAVKVIVKASQMRCELGGQYARVDEHFLVDRNDLTQFRWAQWAFFNNDPFKPAAAHGEEIEATDVKRKRVDSRH